MRVTNYFKVGGRFFFFADHDADGTKRAYRAARHAQGGGRWAANALPVIAWRRPRFSSGLADLPIVGWPNDAVHNEARRERDLFLTLVPVCGEA